MLRSHREASGGLVGGLIARRPGQESRSAELADQSALVSVLSLPGSLLGPFLGRTASRGQPMTRNVDLALPEAATQRRAHWPKKAWAPLKLDRGVMRATVCSRERLRG